MKSSEKPKQKMQNVRFNSIDELLDFLPDDELKLLEQLRKIILECLPQATERLSYNVPYYKINKNICFLWPASVLWGKKKTYSGIRLGFTSGYLLTNENNFLESGNRKQVYWKDITALTVDEAAHIRACIFEAVLIDKEQASYPRNK
jgi:hypothetical protein